MQILKEMAVKLQPGDNVSNPKCNGCNKEIPPKDYFCHFVDALDTEWDFCLKCSIKKLDGIAEFRRFIDNGEFP